jgi:branched-chain amino acid transport system substrate-binding protein
MNKKVCGGILSIVLVLVIGSTILGVTPKAVAVEEEVIVLGCNIPLSGSAAAGWGIPTLRGAEIAVKEINDAGGITIGGKNYKFRAFAADHKYTVEGGRTFGEKLIYEQKGRYVCAVVGSGPCLGMQEVTERAKVLTLYSTWHIEALGPQKPYSFRIMLLGDELSIPVMIAVKKFYPDGKTIAFIAPNNPHGRDIVRSEKELCAKFGWKPVTEEYYEMETTDFYPVVTKIKAKRPDIVDLAGTGSSSGSLILKALYEIGWKGAKFQSTGDHGDVVVKVAGKEATEGYVMGMGWDCSGPLVTPELRAVAEKYKDTYEEPFPYVGACAYFGVKTIVQAMKKANSIDATVVRDTLADMKWNSIFGPTHISGEKKYGIKRVFIYPAIISQVQNGKSVDITKVEFDIE